MQPVDQYLSVLGGGTHPEKVHSNQLCKEKGGHEDRDVFFEGTRRKRPSSKTDECIIYYQLVKHHATINTLNAIFVLVMIRKQQPSNPNHVLL